SKDGVIRDYVGEVLYPEYRVALNANLNVSESLDLFAQLTYRSETENDVDNNVNQTLSEDINTLDSVVYLDLSATYQLADNFRIYAGSNNVLDQEPDIIPRLTRTGSAPGTNTEPRAYDIIGRQFFAGLTYKF
ncbi:TonB-dependent receptor, partial [Alteromonadaceae bacterium A_SAG5]|nr:TonB-dependent receptor [Alteromonadaceae bacterium A_SAG5]